VAELFPFMHMDVRAGLTLGSPPESHEIDGCDDCVWYKESLAWQQRIENGEFIPHGSRQRKSA
jgi:hypothetical protein